jgi:hypothetical protein
MANNIYSSFFIDRLLLSRRLIYTISYFRTLLVAAFLEMATHQKNSRARFILEFVFRVNLKDDQTDKINGTRAESCRNYFLWVFYPFRWSDRRVGCSVSLSHCLPPMRARGAFFGAWFRLHKSWSLIKETHSVRTDEHNLLLLFRAISFIFSEEIT